MTDAPELRPPPEYAHLVWHWICRNDDAPQPWAWTADVWHTPSGNIFRPSVIGVGGWRYYSPCVPLIDDAATVERVARIVETNRYADYSHPKEIARAVIRELMKRAR